ncbi:MAG: DNA recombination protein RmuC [Alphaproteobacteria bacterium]|nr:MAG: DNA recombination protein RmuC [Alphaproteobacteria bacterium]
MILFFCISILSLWLYIRLHKTKQKLAQLHLESTLEKQSLNDRIVFLNQAQEQLSQTFQSLSANALERNNSSFLTLAKSTLEQYTTQATGTLAHKEQAIQHLVDPIKQSLTTMAAKLEELEKSRVGAYEGLKQQVASLIETQQDLRKETVHLSTALKSPNIRGRWGEIQLKRVVELAGLSEHCDFHEQTHISTEDGTLRPDMVVHLPGKKSLIIDAKVPLNSYLEGLECQKPSERTVKFTEHARSLRNHINALGRKAYWQHNTTTITPDFTVLFLPGDTFLSTALEYDPRLIEDSIQKQVIIATPGTLIALLHGVAYSWRQEALSDNAKRIAQLGSELYKRMGDMTSHFQKVGTSLDSAVNAYNRTIGSLETRVMPSARKFKELQVISDTYEISSLAPVDKISRALSTPERGVSMNPQTQNLEASGK